MDYELMGLMSNGVITCNFESLQIEYINKSARRFLQIFGGEEEVPLSQLFKTKNEFISFKDEMIGKIGNIDKFSGIMYVENAEGINLEIYYSAKIIDVFQKKICYVFTNVQETSAETNISFRRLTEELPSGILIISAQAEFIVTYGSPEYYKIIGYEHKDVDLELLQTNLRRLIYEEDREWVMAEIYNYIHYEEDVDIEFRMKTKNQVKWVRLWGRLKITSTGSRYIYALLKDISSRRQPNDREHMEKILLHKVSELSNEILFRLDLQTNVMYFLGGKIESLDMQEYIENFPESFLITNKIHGEDIHIFEELVENFKNGISKPTDIRFLTADGTVKWYQIIYNFITNTAKTPLLVIGKIVDIQEQKMLEERARFDVLTRCYNKATTATEIQNIISDNGPDGRHVFFIIDVDNFKPINDNLGHHFGDLVLQEVSDTLKQSFRKQDIVGRIGGDEFVVFMSNCDNDDIILEKANKLSEVMRKTYEGEHDSYSISGSIGIALFPSHGYNYEDLYKAADKALYESKKQGKDCYTLYYDQITDDNRTTTEMNNSGRERNQLLDTRVIATVFNLLYETRDMKASVRSVIQYLGIHFDVDRCYIFECLEDSEDFINSYDWTRRVGFGYENEIQHITNKEFVDVFSDASDEGIVVINNMNIGDCESIRCAFGKNNAKAILLIDSLKEEQERVFFGVEDCTDKRSWADREIRTLFQVSRIIFAFLINYNKELILQDKIDNLLVD